jgi:hypothetical protein
MGKAYHIALNSSLEIAGWYLSAQTELTVITLENYQVACMSLL